MLNLIATRSLSLRSLELTLKRPPLLPFLFLSKPNPPKLFQFSALSLTPRTPILNVFRSLLLRTLQCTFTILYFSKNLFIVISCDLVFQLSVCVSVGASGT